MTEAHSRIELNGAAATVDDLRHLVQTNYGHFSAMQVRDGGVRGLDLHLDRIVGATGQLFGTALEHERVRACLRHAVAGSREPLSVRVNVFARALDRERLAAPVSADILVMVGPPARAAGAPLRLKSFRYARDLAPIKHVGTFPLFHYRRMAQQAGFDDAVFVDSDGAISEGSIWNIGFRDGDGVAWPDAAQLDGVSMRLLKQGLATAAIATAERRVALDDLVALRAPFFTNSGTAVRPIASIDDVAFAPDPAFMALLQDCHDRNPLQPI